MTASMTAAHIMTQPALAIAPDAPLAQAIGLMTEHKVSGLPVVGPDGALVGILSEGDLLRRIETGTAGRPPGWFTRFLQPGFEARNYVQTHGRRVSEVMTSDVISVDADTPLDEVVALMQKHRVKRLPVVRGGHLVGVVSRADLVRLLGQRLSQATAVVGDGPTRLAIRAAMEAEPWARAHNVTIDVDDGVAQLDGCMFDIQERDALTVLVENVPGVTRVENRIVCIEPYMGMVTYDPNMPLSTGL
jgi:CBS domain-containing protein